VSTYTNIFGGSPVDPASISYTAIALSANVTLQWPTAFQDTTNVVSTIIDVTPAANGLIVTLPPVANSTGGLISVGMSILFANVSLTNSFSVHLSSGAGLLTLAPGQVFYIYLTDNTTVDGIWRTTPFGGGSLGPITSIGITGDGSRLMVNPASIPPGNNFTFTLSPNLESISDLATPGFVSYTGTVFNGRVLTAGDNVVITNGNGVAGNPIISMGNLVSPLTIDNIVLSGNTISTTPTGTNLNINPGTGGEVIFPNQSIVSNQVLKVMAAVSSTGVVGPGSFGVGSVVHAGTGLYTISINTTPFGSLNIVSGSCLSGASNYLFCVASSPIYPTLNVKIIDIATNLPADAAFTFMGT
jgi:hypothetical protein